jgi:uncharacterized protein YjaZ
MKEDLDSTDQQLWSYYAFGGPGIPRWTLYTIGFDVVQSYLATHPDQGITEWTALDAHKLLEESGYTGHRP